MTEITTLLNGLSGTQGADRKRAFDRLITAVYADLHSRACNQVKRERDWSSVRPTALVHEAYEQLLDYNMSFESRSHFMNVAAAAMRRLLVDRARRVNAAKRGSGQIAASITDVTIEDALARDPDRLLDLDAALRTLAPEQVQLVELRYFTGLSVEETAEAMGLQPETVKKRWKVVKTLLYDKLNPSKGEHGRAPGTAPKRHSRRSS